MKHYIVHILAYNSAKSEYFWNARADLYTHGKYLQLIGDRFTVNIVGALKMRNQWYFSLFQKSCDLGGKWLTSTLLSDIYHVLGNMFTGYLLKTSAD